MSLLNKFKTNSYSDFFKSVGRATVNFGIKSC